MTDREALVRGILLQNIRGIAAKYHSRDRVVRANRLLTIAPHAQNRFISGICVVPCPDDSQWHSRCRRCLIVRREKEVPYKPTKETHDECHHSFPR